MTAPGPAHSLLGASGAHRWLNCPGSFKLSQTAPHRPTSSYAALGTVAHDYIERSQGNGFRPIEASEIGKTWHCDGHTGEVDQDFIDGVNVMIDYLDKAVNRTSVLAIEQRVCLDGWFTDQGLPVSLFGTADALLFSPKLLEIADYKNGAGVSVTPVWNPQHLFYAAGAVRLAAIFKNPVPDYLRLTIVQPHAGGDPIRSWDLSLVDLLMWIDEVLKPGVEACLADDAPLVPGTWCRFCPVSHACPALHQAAVDLAKTEFDDEQFIGRTDLGGEQYSYLLADALDTAERAELWIARLREHALDQLQHQVRIPGWELVPTRPTRKWVKPDDDIVTILGGAGLGPELWETRLRSPAQLEKVLNKTRTGKRLWRDTVEGLFDLRSSGVKVGRSPGTTAGEDFTDEA